MSAPPQDTEENHYDETSLMRHRLIARILIEGSLFLQVASYIWIIIPPKDTDDLVLKIIVAGFSGSFFFVVLSVKGFLRQRVYRAQWNSFDRILYRMNFVLVAYPILMAALIYLMASLYPE